MIYLDNSATTAVDRRVLEAMSSAFDGQAFGNPASTHSVGVEARRALESARARVVASIPGRRRRVVFTSGATEANALALLGRAPKGRRKHVVISAIEHPSVLNCARELERSGCRLTIVPPSADGLIDAEAACAAVDGDTALLSVMLVNNEVGTVQPVGTIARRVRAAWPSCHVHVDAVQAIGLVDLTCLAEASSISVSGHKIHGPKGVGALFFDEASAPRPLWFGGGQEGGVRSGTQNVPGAVGLAAAMELALTDWDVTARRLTTLRDQLVEGITGAVEGTSLVGHAALRSPAIAMVAVKGLRGDAIVGALDERGVIASTGSACRSGDPRPSEVLRAMGHALDAGTVRFGLSRETSAEEIERSVAVFADAVETLRKGT